MRNPVEVAAMNDSQLGSYVLLRRAARGAALQPPEGAWSSSEGSGFSSVDLEGARCTVLPIFSTQFYELDLTK